MSANRTRWGWHRLTNEAARRVVADAGVTRGDLVLDVGAGTGAITGPLVDAGARVIAVELHPRRASALRERFADAPVIVVQADAADLRLPRRPFLVVANPPFGVTTALLRRLLAPRSELVAGHLVLPRHEARRWAAGRAPGACRWTRTFDLDVARTIPGSAFVPRRPVDALVLRIARVSGVRV